jgi:hypothetical protein
MTGASYYACACYKHFINKGIFLCDITYKLRMYINEDPGVNIKQGQINKAIFYYLGKLLIWLSVEYHKLSKETCIGQAGDCLCQGTATTCN